MRMLPLLLRLQAIALLIFAPAAVLAQCYKCNHVTQTCDPNGGVGWMSCRYVAGEGCYVEGACSDMFSARAVAPDGAFLKTEDALGGASATARLAVEPKPRVEPLYRFATSVPATPRFTRGCGASVIARQYDGQLARDLRRRSKRITI